LLGSAAPHDLDAPRHRHAEKVLQLNRPLDRPDADIRLALAAHMVGTLDAYVGHVAGVHYWESLNGVRCTHRSVDRTRR
jgi:hypothetical protein